MSNWFELKVIVFDICAVCFLEDNVLSNTTPKYWTNCIFTPVARCAVLCWEKLFLIQKNRPTVLLKFYVKHECTILSTHCFDLACTYITASSVRIWILTTEQIEGRTLIKILNNKVPKTEPWDTPNWAVYRSGLSPCCKLYVVCWKF